MKAAIAQDKAKQELDFRIRAKEQGDDIRRRIKQGLESIKASRQANAWQTNLMRRDNERIAIENKELIVEENRRKAEETRIKKELAKESRVKDAADKAAKVREFQLSKLDIEMRRQMEAQELIARLEREERELVNRLKTINKMA